MLIPIIKESERQEMSVEFIKAMNPKSTIKEICDWWLTKIDSSQLALLEGLKKESVEVKDILNKLITEQFKYGYEHDNYDIRGVDWTRIINTAFSKFSLEESITYLKNK